MSDESFRNNFQVYPPLSTGGGGGGGVPIGTGFYHVTGGVMDPAAVVITIPSLKRVQTVNSATGAQVVNMSLYDAVIFNMIGNISVTFSNGADLQECTLRFVQPAFGGCFASFGVGVQFGIDIPSFTSNTSALKTDYVGIRRNSIAGRYEVVAYARGY